jgi:hypothetical protein
MKINLVLIICILFLGCNVKKSNNNEVSTYKQDDEPLIYEQGTIENVLYFYVSYLDIPSSINTYRISSIYLPSDINIEDYLKKTRSIDKLISAEELANLPNLENLVIRSLSTNLSFLENITQIKSLRIDLSGYGRFGDLEPLKYLVNLEYLDLSGL